MTMALRVLAIGGLAGLAGSVLTWGGVHLLGTAAGGAMGAAIAGVLGAAGAWRAAAEVARRVVERLAEAGQRPGDGIVALEERLSRLAGAIGARAELDDLERLAATLGTADGDPSDGDPGHVAHPRGARARIEM